MLSYLCCLGKKRQWENNEDESEDVHERGIMKKPEEDEVSQSSNVSSVARSMLFMPLL